MPHVIQISLEPVAPDDRLTPGYFDIEDELLRNIAEYVDEDSQPVETLSMFQRCLTNGNPHAEPFHNGEERGVWFREGFKEAFFQKPFDVFLRLAQKLAKETTLDSFIHDGPEGDVFALGEAYNERYGWYVYYDAMTMTLDDFIRHHARAGVRYYYGGIVYYRL